MDEFEVSHTSRSIPVPESGHELAEAEDESTDLLGLDQPLKLVSRAKIAKIDDERMLTNPNGIKYIAKNYSKVNRIIKKNDLKLSQKIAKSSNLTSSAQRRLKYENEYNNLSSILQFYQLWCHGLFPKANFKDCLKLIRVYGGNHLT